ncbi:hypothetical protein [Corynebacterium comes]|uniref:hypothetical protein n=1 Tax=Corynebacterium comes TaxID=2675218 RepID=UPI001E3E9B7F|nr:hypothetical protein [Corynebacterium comes]
MRIRSIGTGGGRFAAGTGSADNVPCGNGGAGSRSAGVSGSTIVPTVSLTPSIDIVVPLLLAPGCASRLLVTPTRSVDNADARALA